MKKFLRLFATLSTALVLFCTASFSAVFACDMTKDELLEKYADYYRIVTYADGSYHCEVLFQGHCGGVFLDESGNECTPEEAGWVAAAITPNEYCQEKTFTCERTFSCLFSDGFYYAILDDETAVVAGCDYGFFNDKQATCLSIPKDFDGHVVTEIAASAFSCVKNFIPSLEKIEIPDTVEIIRYGAFYNAFFGQGETCQINIPSQIKCIELNAYGGDACKALGKTVVLPKSLEFIDQLAFGMDGTKYITVENESLVLCPHGLGYYLQRVALPNSITADEVIAYYLGKQSARTAEAALSPTGDVNQDGATNVSDAILLSRYLAEDTSVSITALGLLMADCNQNGIVDSADVTAILQTIAASA